MSRGWWALIVVGVVLAYWTTGRMDPALANVGLNYNACVQVIGTWYCGDDAVRMQKNIREIQQNLNTP